MKFYWECETEWDRKQNVPSGDMLAVFLDTRNGNGEYDAVRIRVLEDSSYLVRNLKVTLGYLNRWCRKFEREEILALKPKVIENIEKAKDKKYRNSKRLKRENAITQRVSTMREPTPHNLKF